MADTAPPPRPSSTGPALDARAVVVLGAALGLTSVAGDGLLLPQVAEGGPRAMALLGLTLGLSLGALVCGHLRRPGPGLARLLAAAVLLGGALTAWWLPRAHQLLVEVLAGGSPLPGSVLVVGSSLLASAPLTLPLGALLGLALSSGGRHTRPALLLGLAAGVGASPWLAEVLLGRQGSLLAATVAAASAAAVFSECPQLGRRPRALPAGAAAALAGAATLLTLAHHLGLARIDLGSLTSRLLPAGALFGAALGAGLLPAARARSAWLLAAAGPVLALGLAPGAADHVPPGRLADLATVALVSLPIGWLAGRCLGARDAAGLPAWDLPMALGLPPSLVLVVGLPRLGPLPTLVLGGLALLVAAAAGTGWRRALTDAVPALALAAALTWLPLPAPRGPVPAVDVHHADRGLASLVRTDAGRELLALDGLAPLARPLAQQRRLVHLPLLLAPTAQRVLLVADDLGESAAAALDHLRPELTWLRPFPVPWTRLDQDQLGRLHEAHGNERLHLALEQAPYELIVAVPDPRARRRAALLGTQEFYAECAGRLTPAGLLCQWWDLSSIDVNDLKGVIGGAVATFEHVYLALDHPRSRRPCLAILASDRPLRLAPPALEQALAERPAVAADWRALGLDAVLSACLIQQQTGVARLIAPAERRLTDDRSTLGVRGGLARLPQPETTLTAARTFTARRCDPSAWLSVPQFEREALGARVRDVLRGWQHLVGAAQDELVRTWPEVVPFEELADGDTTPAEAGRLAQALASLPDWPYLLERVLGIAVAWEGAGRLVEAEDLLRAAIDELPASPDLRYALARLQERRGQTADACELYGTVLAFDDQHVQARAALARLCDDG